MANTGIAPPNYDTPVGIVRVLLGDTDAENVSGGSGEYMWYSDGEIVALLSAFGENPLRAAAQALRGVAASQALLLKKWSADDLTVDGPAITRALKDLARDLDARADDALAMEDIFELSYPGGNTEFWPEGMPATGRIGRTTWPNIDDGGYTQDGGIIWVP